MKQSHIGELNLCINGVRSYILFISNVNIIMVHVGMNRTAKIRNRYRLIEKLSISKYLKESKKEYYFLSQNEWFKSTGEDMDKYLKISLEEVRLLRDNYFSCK